MSPGTLLYIGGFELPDRNAAALRVLSNAKILRDLGYKVVLIGVRKSKLKGLLQYPGTIDGFECWSVEYPRTKKEWGQYLTGLSCIGELLDKYSDGFSGIICYNYPALAQWRLFSKCRKLGGKCIADITEWYDASGGSSMLRLAKAIDTWLLMNVVNRRSDGVIAISRMIAKFYSGRRFPVVELPTLFDTGEIRDPMRAAGSSHSKKFIYVGNPFSVGRVNKARSNVKDRLDVCVKLFKRLDEAGYDFYFDIYGVDISDYLSVFPEDADLIGAANQKIRFHGRVDNKFARDLVAKSDFSIFIRDPSRVTLAGFPTKLAESVSVGTPVITSDQENLRKYANTPGLFLLKRGLEYGYLESFMQLTADDLCRLKRDTFESKKFDFHRYIDEFAYFLDEI